MLVRKKIRAITLISLLICLVAALLCACSNYELSTPNGVGIDENYFVSWIPVEEARSYQIEVKNISDETTETFTARQESISLERLAEGDYDIRVKAIGGAGNKKQSDWSKTVQFHRDYEAGYTYQLINNNTEYEIARANRAAGDVVIEETYRGKPVTAIGDVAFRSNKTITGIVLSDNIRSIGASAFYNCTALQSVQMPDTLTSIGVQAFQSCSALKKITIPSGVTVLEEGIFSYCNSLEEVVLHDSITTIGKYAFTHCSSLKEFQFPAALTAIYPNAFDSASALVSLTFNDALTSIGPYAFRNCSTLEAIAFGAGSRLVEINYYAFSNCPKLNGVRLPNRLSRIGDAAFSHTSALDDITLPPTVATIGSNAFYLSKLHTDAEEAQRPCYYADKWVVGRTTAFDEVTNIDANFFPEGMVGIANSVFFEAPNLEAVILADSIKIIGTDAFYGCPELGRVGSQNRGLELKAETIGSYAFANCPKLTQLNLGEGVKNIQSYAFYDCTSLNNNSRSSLIPSTVVSIGIGAFGKTLLWEQASDVVYAGNWVVGFKEDAKIKDVVLETPEDIPEVVGIADYAFNGCSTLSSINGMETVRYIGTGAFYGCESLMALSLGRNITEIKAATFYGCGSLLSIDIPPYVSSIGALAFYKCSRLTAVNGLEYSNVETIGTGAFFRCLALRNIKLVGDSAEDKQSATIKTIAPYAFYACKEMTELEIPDSVQTIGGFAFSHCEGLKTLHLGNNLREIGAYAFSSCNELTAIVIPDSVKTIGAAAFLSNRNVNKLQLGNGVETIGTAAFADIRNLKQVVIPDSVKTIGESAFRGCDSLRSITIGSGVKEIGQHAFLGCASLTVYIEEQSRPEGWNYRWNSSYRPTVWGCNLAEEENYVQSITIGEETFPDTLAVIHYTAPTRRGYTFKGWSLEPNGGGDLLDADVIASLEVGTVIYSVWEEANPDDEKDLFHWTIDGMPIPIEGEEADNVFSEKEPSEKKQ